MSYPTMLAILQSEADAPRVLGFAVPFAARQKSHLIGLHAEALPIAFAAAASPIGGAVADFSPELLEAAQRSHAAIRSLFEERARAEGISAEWRGFDNVSGDSAVSGIESARSADLVIASQNDPQADSRASANLEALIFESGRPVLLLPYSRTSQAEFKKVLLAWNGSKEAARAAFDALPLMMAASEVEVLTVDAEDSLQQDSGLAGAAIASALARHGVNVTMRAEQSAGQSDADSIARRTAEGGADLLVMGAYGRSRLSELVFGGVTRKTLHSLTVPTLMSR